MRKIFLTWLVGAAISFVLRQLKKFGKETDWDTVKDDLGARVTDLVPGEFFDDEAVNISNAFVDAVKRGLSQTKHLEIVFDHLQAEEWDKAINALRDFLLKAWRPKTHSEEVAMSLVENYTV